MSLTKDEALREFMIEEMIEFDLNNSPIGVIMFLASEQLRQSYESMSTESFQNAVELYKEINPSDTKGFRDH